jgi:hypothetical protein
VEIVSSNAAMRIVMPAKKARMDDFGCATSRFSMRRKRIQTERSSDADAKAASSE